MLVTVNGELKNESIIHIYHQEVGWSARDHTIYCLLWTPHQKGEDALILYNALVVSWAFAQQSLCWNIIKCMYCIDQTLF